MSLLNPSSERRLKELYAKVPQVDCQNCGGCCGPVEVSPLEKQIITAYCKEHNITVGSFFSPGRLLLALTDEYTCPMRLNGRCAIYEVRPLICRLQGTTSGLPCPNVKECKFPLSDRAAGVLLKQSWRV